MQTLALMRTTLPWKAALFLCTRGVRLIAAFTQM